MSRLAIIGTGIAGLGAAHFLHRHHELTIFEANDHVGGHIQTAAALPSDNLPPPSVDTGFMVYNETNSPLLTRLFAAIQVPVTKATLSLSVRDDLSGLEWNTSSLNRLFAQRNNLLNLRFLKLLATVRRFNKEAVAALEDAATSTMTVGDYVRSRGYGEDLFNLHLLPMSTALWNASPETLPSFPAAMVLRLFQSHGLLGFSVPEQWLMVDGGSRAYRDRLIAPFRGSIQLGRPVVRIIRNGPGRGVIVMTAEGATHTFDQVIVTTQADQALRLLVNPTPDESRLLCEFRYEPCTATLHTDESLLPRTPLARAARNFQLTRDSVGRLSSSTHYRMNELQGVSDREDYIVSINRPDAIDPTKIVERIHFAHPLFTPESVRAQIELPKLNEQARGRTETYFAGAYFRDGLHEDAVMSAAQVSGLLLGRDAWAA